MARRTTPARVRLCNPKIKSTFNLDMAIDAATSIVDEVESCAAAKGKTLSAQRLEIIESWLSAHFAYISTPTNLTSKSVGGASQSFAQGQVGTGLDASPYGAQASLMDTSGCLEALMGETVSFTWLGDNEEDYDVDWN